MWHHDRDHLAKARDLLGMCTIGFYHWQHMPLLRESYRQSQKICGRSLLKQQQLGSHVQIRGRKAIWHHHCQRRVLGT
jgi:hypothetical protein